MRDLTKASMIRIADTMGASNAAFDATYQNAHASIARIPNLEDYNLLYAINDLLNALNQLSRQPLAQTNTPALDYVAGLASKTNIVFQKPLSKQAIPFPYDSTLEHLARQYLKDPDRWTEIAIMNGLREPYVDEVGFDRPLLANGNLSEIVISDASNLRINQPIWIQSNIVPREKRHIINIKKLSPQNIVLTLDGPGNLDRYKSIDKAYLHAFLPDTVNSQQLIFIPSDKNVADNSELTKIPGIDVFDNLLEVGGVDLLLTNDNDLAITQDGDCRLAYGMSAIVQRAKIALATPQGTLFRHPNFGLPLQIGQSIADLDMGGLRTACQNVFANDSAFNGLSSVKISQKGPVVSIGIGLFVTGQDTPISLSIDIKK